MYTERKGEFDFKKQMLLACKVKVNYCSLHFEHHFGYVPSVIMKQKSYPPSTKQINSPILYGESIRV